MDFFHNIRFPIAIALGASGGPVRQTKVTTLNSGKEQRLSRWAHSRRQFNAGTGVKTIDDIATVIAFFEERRGRLYSFLWKDLLDYKSSAFSIVPNAMDQVIGEGDGLNVEFQLVKHYGALEDSYLRAITKPIENSVLLAIDGQIVDPSYFSVDYLTGKILFSDAHIPAEGSIITAGFEFDIMARFDTDALFVDQVSFKAGAIPDIPILEVLEQ